MDNNPVALNDVLGLSTGGDDEKGKPVPGGDDPNGPPSLPESRKPPMPKDEENNKKDGKFWDAVIIKGINTFRIPGEWPDFFEPILPEGARITWIYMEDYVKGKNSGNEIYVGAGSVKSIEYKGKTYNARFDLETGEFKHYETEDGEELFYIFHVNKSKISVQGDGFSSLDLLGGFYVKWAFSLSVVKNWKNLVKITSLVRKDSKLLKLAKETFKGNEELQKEANGLLGQLMQGNMNPGIGTKGIGKGIFESRSRGGARIYFRNVKDGVEIVGYSSKETQIQVINRILKIYK